VIDQAHEADPLTGRAPFLGQRLKRAGLAGEIGTKVHFGQRAGWNIGVANIDFRFRLGGHGQDSRINLVVAPTLLKQMQDEKRRMC
jgi:hypothetical protein